MASRRMFSMEVVDIDHFLEMPATARLLYFDLGMRADDDGFITPLKVMRTTNASADDLKILAAKGLVHIFDDGVLVILHWRRNNKLDASKYTSSIYFPRLKTLEKQGLYLPTKSSGRPKVSSESQPKRVPEGSLKGSDKGPEKGPQYSIVQDSVVEGSNNTPLPPKGDGDKAKKTAEAKPKEVIGEDHPMLLLWQKAVGTNLRSKLPENVKAGEELRDMLGRERFVEMLKAVRYIRADNHASRNLQIALVNYCGLLKRIEDVEAYYQGKMERTEVNRLEGTGPRKGLVAI